MRGRAKQKFKNGLVSDRLGNSSQASENQQSKLLASSIIMQGSISYITSCQGFKYKNKISNGKYSLISVTRAE